MAKKRHSGQFQKGHEPLKVCGRPRGSTKISPSIDDQVDRQRKAWRKQVRDVLDEVPSLIDTLINSAGALYKAILEIESKPDLSDNSIDRLNKLTTSLRLCVSEIDKLTHRERKIAIEEEKNYRPPRNY